MVAQYPVGCRVVAGRHPQVAAPVRVQAVGVVFGQHPALVQDADAAVQAGDLGQQVAGDQHGGAVLAGQAGQQGADLHHAGGIQAVDGFVEDEQFGTVEEGFGQGQALQVAHRQGAGAPPGVGGQGQPFDDVLHVPAGVFQLAQAGAQVQVLGHGQLGVGGRGLDQVAGAGPGQTLSG
ncbi:hypothetical protein OG884_35125 [Streptosporangium sp. NBC_01755]|nr:hypothetical protein [Streptosporangium sp. NBC_01755]WSC99953.1 hypothetical protein OG884_35125 [Streptosporangium sp. NBC_01755]